MKLASFKLNKEQVFVLIPAVLSFIFLLLALIFWRLAANRPQLKLINLKTPAKLAAHLKNNSSSLNQPLILLGLAALEEPTSSLTAKTVVNSSLPLPPPNSPSIAVSAPSSLSVRSADGLNLSLAPQELVRVYYAGGSYYLILAQQTKAITQQPLIFFNEGNQPIYLNDYTDLNWDKTVNLNAFSGRIEVVYSPTSKKLWAVNELPLETYLEGVTEADPDSPPEHLKTMAIVARSYAYYHVKNGGRHPGEPFHLKNSRNGNGDDQVYQGYLAAARLTQIAQAAKQTQGQVVTYNGQPVITPYSASAGGRTLSPQEAGWNYDWPWVKSVPDPDTAGRPRSGHGVGLSGLGAKARAQRGQTASQILQYYFPATKIGQVNTDGMSIRVAIYAAG